MGSSRYHVITQGAAIPRICPDMDISHEVDLTTLLRLHTLIA